MGSSVHKCLQSVAKEAMVHYTSKHNDVQKKQGKGVTDTNLKFNVFFNHFDIFYFCIFQLNDKRKSFHIHNCIVLYIPTFLHVN